MSQMQYFKKNPKTGQVTWIYKDYVFKGFRTANCERLNYSQFIGKNTDLVWSHAMPEVWPNHTMNRTTIQKKS